MAWPVSELLGRQAALMLGGVPALAGWLMITYSSLANSSNAFLGIIYVGRLLTGFSTGWSIFCVSVSVLYNNTEQGQSMLLCIITRISFF